MRFLIEIALVGIVQSFALNRLGHCRPFALNRKQRATTNDATYKQLRKRLDKLGSENHEESTAWIKAIRAASIIQLGPNDSWKEDEGLIQVQRMRKEHLKNEVDVPETEHEYETYLDVIKLPKPTPTETYNAAPQFLFIRPDEYALFKCFGQREQHWCILTGNPGISKSWFQWKFILFSYRQDLFNQLFPPESQAQEINNQPPTQGGKTADPAFTKQAQVEPGRQAIVEQDELVIPQLIVRTIAGESSLLFFVNQDHHDVLTVKHSPKHLDLFTDKNSTILWEPGSVNTAVYFQGSASRIIATVSPNEDRFHEFQKNAELFYMPCPSELQLRLMGQIYREVGKKNYPSDEEIHERVIKYGPFIRIVLSLSRDKIEKFEQSRQDEIASTCSTEQTLQDAVRASVQVMAGPSGMSRFSHRLARYVVHRESAGPFFGYTRPFYRFSCEEVRNVISIEIAKMNIEAVKQHLIAVNKGDTRLEDTIPIYLERIFELYALTGLQWKCCRMEVQGQSTSPPAWEQFSVTLQRVERKLEGVEKMESKVLYYPSDRTLPLVDMYYMVEPKNADPKNAEPKKLVGIQATMAKQHAKPVSVYENFFELVGTTPEHTKLQLYYLILPRHIESYHKPSHSESKFWKNVKSEIGSRWKKNIEFYALVPPDDFGPKTK